MAHYTKTEGLEPTPAAPKPMKMGTTKSKRARTDMPPPVPAFQDSSFLPDTIRSNVMPYVRLHCHTEQSMIQGAVATPYPQATYDTLIKPRQLHISHHVKIIGPAMTSNVNGTLYRLTLRAGDCVFVFKPGMEVEGIIDLCDESTHIVAKAMVPSAPEVFTICEEVVVFPEFQPKLTDVDLDLGITLFGIIPKDSKSVEVFHCFEFHSCSVTQLGKEMYEDTVPDDFKVQSTTGVTGGAFYSTTGLVVANEVVFNLEIYHKEVSCAARKPLRKSQITF